MFATFSPCGNKVAYVMGNNLYVQDVHTFKITPLTTDGSHTIINGTFDWVYEEEFRLRRGFRWASDSKSIAFWQMDQSGVRVVNLINNTDHLYPQPIPIPYPKAGEQNPSCRIGVVAIEGGKASSSSRGKKMSSSSGAAEGRDDYSDEDNLEKTLAEDDNFGSLDSSSAPPAPPSITWIHVPGDARNHYIASLDWIPGTNELAFQRLNRLQNTVHVIVAEPATGKIRIAFTDRDDAWIDLQSAAWYGEESSGIRFIREGHKFLWLSERNGWRQLFLVDRHTGICTPLTPPTFDVTEIAGVDEEGKWAYYIASPDDPLRRYLYRTTMDVSEGGKTTSIAPQERITPPDVPGTHSYRFSRDGKYAIHVYSTFSTPETTDIVSMPDHKVIAVLADNKNLRERLAKGNLPKPEFFRIPIDNGRVELDAYIIHPPSFDPNLKYPVLFYVYGEPAMQVVRDIWGGRTSLWHMMLAQHNYVIISIDNRGTPSPRGRDWRKCIYRKIGIRAPADQAAATQALLRSRKYLDPKRVAIWGWSGGGSMSLNAIFRYPDLYQTAIAIAPVPNQRVYDTVYQERYMGLPSDNVEGFRDGSPITHAKNLKGNLLLVHGTGDDNCHYAGTEVLINELIQHNKQFSMLAYPNRSHSISEGHNTTRHLFTLLTNYLTQHVPSVPILMKNDEE
jgi:dipeptidyl-peptidase-4